LKNYCNNAWLLNKHTGFSTLRALLPAGVNSGLSGDTYKEPIILKGEISYRKARFLTVMHAFCFQTVKSANTRVAVLRGVITVVRYPCRVGILYSLEASALLIFSSRGGSPLLVPVARIPTGSFAKWPFLPSHHLQARDLLLIPCLQLQVAWAWVVVVHHGRKQI
jgi:hypothetical protein